MPGNSKESQRYSKMSYWKSSQIGDLLNTTPVRTWLRTFHQKKYWAPTIRIASWYWQIDAKSLRKKLNTTWADVITFGEFVVDESINFLIANYRKRRILARLGATWRLITRNSSQFDAANHIWQQPTFQDCGRRNPEFTMIIVTSWLPKYLRNVSDLLLMSGKPKLCCFVSWNYLITMPSVWQSLCVIN
jgi:hypothetical protein